MFKATRIGLSSMAARRISGNFLCVSKGAKEDFRANAERINILLGSRCRGGFAALILEVIDHTGGFGNDAVGQMPFAAFDNKIHSGAHLLPFVDRGLGSE